MPSYPHGNRPNQRRYRRPLLAAGAAVLRPLLAGADGAALYERMAGAL